MDQVIQHKYIDIRGVKLHIAEIGTGPKVVVLLHGFPEVWYSWRHQMIALAAAGYRAIAPDLRGSVDENFYIVELIVKVPALCIIGDKDFALKFPGREEYIRSGKVKDFVPDLEIIHLPEGTHFVQEQFPEQVNQLFLAFLNKHV